MKRSLFGLYASVGSYRIVRKKSAEIISAADKHVVGCPDPASDVDMSEWMRRLLAFCFRTSVEVAIVFLIPLSLFLFLAHVKKACKRRVLR